MVLSTKYMIIRSPNCVALENVRMESTGCIVNCRQKEKTGVRLIFFLFSRVLKWPVLTGS